MPKFEEALDRFAGLTDDHCRYIIGELDGPWHFCRAPRGKRADGTPVSYRYCNEHFALCTQSGGYKARQPSVRAQQASRADEAGMFDQEAA